MLQRILKINSLIIIGMIIAIIISVSILIIIDNIEAQSTYLTPVNQYIIPYELHVILDDCKHWGNNDRDLHPHAHFNGTHAINNLDCKWVTIGKEPNPIQLDDLIILLFIL